MSRTLLVESYVRHKHGARRTMPGTIDAPNFRTDVDLSGDVNGTDVSLTSSNSGHSI